MNEFEALKRLRQETCPATYNPDFNKEECLEIIEKALLELKAIKEAKPSEALNCIDYIENKLGDLRYECKRTQNHRCDNLFIQEQTFTTIKQALLKQLSGSQYTDICFDEAIIPSDAINSLNKLWSSFISSTRTSEKYVEENPFVARHINDYDAIKEALLKAEKQEKLIAELCDYCGFDNLYPYDNLEEIEITFKDTFDNYQRQRIESLGRLIKYKKALEFVKEHFIFEDRGAETYANQTKYLVKLESKDTSAVIHIHLDTQEEFELLKEMLDND